MIAAMLLGASAAAAQPPSATPVPVPPPVVRMVAPPAPAADAELQRYLDTTGARPARFRSGGMGFEDYPAAALRAGAQGRVVFSYVVGPEGRVVSCAIVESSGHSVLDSSTCALVQRRFRFYPAQDANGAPVAETRTDVIRWSLSAAPPPAADPQAKQD